VIDLHCHVIPGVDDGPATIDESLALCRAALVAGTTKIIATPHVNWTYPGVDAATVHEGVAAVNAALEQESIGVEVDAGAEIALSRIGDLSEVEIASLRLGEGPYLLVECPHQGGAPTAIQQMLHGFAASGHSIVLAHPERCPVFQSDPRWGDGVLFYEYFHGDTGAGLGAAHQTGWTALVIELIRGNARSVIV